MPTAPLQRLTRRAIWSASASVTLLFLTSTSSLPSVPVPPSGFSLGLEKVFPGRPDLIGTALRGSQGRAREFPQFHLGTPTQSNPQATDRYLEGLPFGREIRGAAQRYGVDSLLLVSVIEAESSFHADAVSSKGAQGLMQLMPVHFASMDPTLDAIDPLDPEVNLDLGTRYLRDLRKRYGGNLELALAAYHAGPGTVDRFGGFPPYRETQAYVGRVLKLYSEHLNEVAATAPRLAATAPVVAASPVETASKLGS